MREGGKTGRKTPSFFMLRQTPVTASDIRTANKNAVGGKPDRCVKGKPCSAACINVEMICLVDLPEPIAVEVSRLRELILKAKTHMVGSEDEKGNFSGGMFKALQTPREAAEWLLEHKEELALWGIDSTKLNAVIKNNPDLITVGTEPGTGKSPNLPKDFVPGVDKLEAVMSKGAERQGGTQGSWHDQMAKVNAYKLALDTSKYLGEVGPDMFNKTYSDRVAHMVGNKFKADEILEDLRKQGNLGDGIYRSGGLGKVDPNKRSRQWDQGLSDMHRFYGLPENTTTSGLNPSGLYKPSVRTYGDQFGEIFKAAGMSDKAGPFASQASWIEYSGNAVKSRFQEIFEKASPSLVYVTRNDNKPLTDAIVNSPNRGATATYSFKMGDKKEVESVFVVRNYANGERGVIVSSLHPGSGFTGGRQQVRPYLLEVARFMKETGRAPSDSEMKTIQGRVQETWSKFNKGSIQPVSVSRVSEPGERIRESPSKKTTINTATKTTGASTPSITKTTGVPSATVKTNSNPQPSLKSEVRPKSQPPTSERPKYRPQGMDPVKWIVEAPPGGNYSARDVWNALSNYNQNKAGWKDQVKQIGLQVREKYGGHLAKGEKMEDFRKRLILNGLLPQPSGENFREHKPSTRWDMLPLERHQPSRMG